MVNLEKKKKNRNLFSSILSLIFFLIFIIIPLQLMVNNLKDVPKVIDGNILIIYLINVIFFFLVIFLFNKKLKFFINNKFVIYFSFLFLVWIILNGIMFPTIGGSTDFWKQYLGSFRLRYMLIFKALFTLLITFLIFKIEIFKSNFIKFVFYFSILSLCINSFIFVNKFLFINKNSNFDLNKINIGTNNLLVISFDGINGDIISDLIRDEENKEIFKDFDLYSNYIVSFPLTLLSISSELTHQTDLKQVTNDDLIINQNEKIIDRIYTYGSYNKIFNGKNKIFEGSYYAESNSFKLNTLFQTVLFPSFSRWGTFKTYHFFNNLRNSLFYNNILNFLTFNFLPTNLNVFNDYYRISSAEVLKIFHQKNYSNLDTNSAYFFHFKFSHWYIHFDENCKYTPMYDVHGNINKLQNYDGNVKNTMCVLRKIRSIIKSFKQNDIYQKNTIVFKSDHGKPIGFHKTNLFNQGINDNMRWSIGRYNSFFMIKEKNKVNSSINIFNENVGSKFLYDYFCNHLPFKLDCRIKSEDTVLIPINRSAFQNLKDFKKIGINEFISLDF